MLRGRGFDSRHLHHPPSSRIAGLWRDVSPKPGRRRTL